ncbi:immunity protein YezG family protein [Salinithrix halophila]|uniref:Immunity protein YezG family protein n=1 Tax=Salinithrix halophila TaxID=1485204 RepID=A0ABV8JFV1_9BACL
MDDTKMDRIVGHYQKVGQLVHEMIPEEWEKVYIYGEMEADGGAIFFYYYPSESDKPVYSLDIPELFEVDEEAFEELEDQLYPTLRASWKEFKDSPQEPWSTFTMIMDRSGKYEVKNGYEDLSGIDLSDRYLAWRYKYLGIGPKSDYEKKCLEQYLKKVENK